MRDYRKYAVYGRAHDLVLRIYAETRAFPSDERFGLTSQLRRAATSIPANLAEGAGRPSEIEFARFIDISLGSSNEVEYELRLANDLGYLPDSAHETLAREVSEIRRMLVSLRQRVRPVS